MNVHPMYLVAYLSEETNYKWGSVRFNFLILLITKDINLIKSSM